MTLTQQQIDDITTRIRQELQSYLNNISQELQLMIEIHRIYGLELNTPLIVSQSDRIVDNIQQNIIQTGNTTSTSITRI